MQFFSCEKTHNDAEIVPNENAVKNIRSLWRQLMSISPHAHMTCLISIPPTIPKTRSVSWFKHFFCVHL